MLDKCVDPVSGGLNARTAQLGKFGGSTNGLARSDRHHDGVGQRLGLLL
ncbi:MAG TPA: hypothetical protein VFU50_15020 [Terriglobales bacterium]|nr:hypothetical protein [Terriglobales bacterium]